MASQYSRVASAVVFLEAHGPEGRRRGSGVVLHGDGFVATAAHVVEEAERIDVHFAQGTVQRARIATLSRTEDLALLSVPSVPPDTFVPGLANSDALAVGQPIYCIGAPLGLRHTLTAGIISAIRSNHGSTLSFHPRNVIQTDAAINQGNSGGALFNRQGEVVGITSFIESQTGGSVGLGFAVPSNTVRRRLFNAAIPYVGLMLRRVPSPLAALLHWPYGSPLLIERVAPGSPAAQAGLRGGYIPTDFAGIKILMGGDLIIRVGDLEPGQGGDVHTMLQALRRGDVLRYTIVREGRTMPVDITVGDIIQIPKLGPPS